MTMSIDDEINALLETIHRETDPTESALESALADALAEPELSETEMDSIIDQQDAARNAEIDAEILAEIETDGMGNPLDGGPVEPFAPGAAAIHDYVAAHAPTAAPQEAAAASPVLDTGPVPESAVGGRRAAESFISGFEDDDLQEGIPELLAMIRAALPPMPGDEPTPPPVLRDYLVHIGADVRCYAKHIVAAHSADEARAYFMREIKCGGFPLGTFKPEEVQGDITMAIDDEEFIDMEAGTASYRELESKLERAMGLLGETLDAWEGEEDSVKEEHAEHIADIQMFLEGTVDEEILAMIDGKDDEDES
jgi:hypothetical protein